MQQFAFSPNCSFLLINLLVIGITLQLTYHIFEHTPTEKPGTLIVHWPFLLSPLGQWEALSFEIPQANVFTVIVLPQILVTQCHAWCSQIWHLVIVWQDHSTNCSLFRLADLRSAGQKAIEAFAMDCHLPFYGSSGSKRIASSAKPALSIIFFPLLYLFLHQWRPHCQHNKNIFAIFFDYQYFPLLFNLTEQLVTLCFDFAFYSYTSIVPRHYTVLYR